METTFEGTAEPARATARRLRSDLEEGLEGIKSLATAEMQRLIADIEELLPRISGVEDADVVSVRARILRTLEAAKAGIADGTDALKRQAASTVTATDDYVHRNPWAAIGVAALVGALLGALASRRSS